MSCVVSVFVFQTRLRTSPHAGWRILESWSWAGASGILGAAMEFASQRQFAESVEFGRNVLRVRVQGPRKGRGPSVRLPPSGPLPSQPGGRAARRRTEFSSGFRYGVSCSCPTHEHVDFCLLVTTATFTRTRAPPRSAGRFRRAWTPAFRTFTL